MIAALGLTQVPSAAEASQRTELTSCPQKPPTKTVRTSFCASFTSIFESCSQPCQPLFMHENPACAARLRSGGVIQLADYRRSFLSSYPAQRANPAPPAQSASCRPWSSQSPQCAGGAWSRPSAPGLLVSSAIIAPVDLHLGAFLSSLQVSPSCVVVGVPTGELPWQVITSP